MHVFVTSSNIQVHSSHRNEWVFQSKLFYRWPGCAKPQRPTRHAGGRKGPWSLNGWTSPGPWSRLEPMKRKKREIEGWEVMSRVREKTNFKLSRIRKIWIIHFFPKQRGHQWQEHKFLVISSCAMPISGSLSLPRACTSRGRARCPRSCQFGSFLAPLPHQRGTGRSPIIMHQTEHNQWNKTLSCCAKMSPFNFSHHESY